MMRRAIGMFLLFAVPCGFGAEIVDVPSSHDIVVTSTTVTLHGHCPANGTVRVTVGASAPRTATVTGTDWKLQEVILNPGFNRLAIENNGRVDVVGLTCVPITPPKQQQKVFIKWTPGADAELKKIADHTLSRKLNPQERNDFVKQVKSRTKELVATAFSGVAGVTMTCVPDDDTHVALMTMDMDIAYGMFNAPDCMDATPNDQSRISVAYLAKRMIDDLDDDWQPMLKDDSLKVRIEDVAQSLARTAAHEIAHGLGLVAGTGDCSWMMGNSSGHTRPLEPADVVRSGDGTFLMDDDHEPFNRLGYPTEQRTNSRLPLAFCEFNRSYLGLLLP